jgi:hypothetical protein
MDRFQYVDLDAEYAFITHQEFSSGMVSAGCRAPSSQENAAGRPLSRANNPYIWDRIGIPCPDAISCLDGHQIIKKYDKRAADIK